MDTVIVERSEIEETGEYDLEGLFLRLDFAIGSVGAKRVVLDTIESLFSGFSNQAILRAELRRLFRFLKERGVTVVLTGERGEGQLTRQGLEEYVSDCVILLDHRVDEQVSTRRLRIVKYRGSSHGTNEYPFIIDRLGLEVLPVTALQLQHSASTERISSSGIPRLDAMLGGQGFFRGTSILVSGTAGTGKSSLSAHFADATCRRGERCLYFALEESPAADRPQHALDRSRPRAVGAARAAAVPRQPADAVRAGDAPGHHLPGRPGARAERGRGRSAVQPLDDRLGYSEVMAALLRLVDFLKSRAGHGAVHQPDRRTATPRTQTELGVSSLMDTWLSLRNLESNGERNRGLYVLKSRGMNHSNQIREFLLTDHGVELVDVYLGAEGILTGSARLSQEARERAESAPAPGGAGGAAAPSRPPASRSRGADRQPARRARDRGGGDGQAEPPDGAAGAGPACRPRRRWPPPARARGVLRRPITAETAVETRVPGRGATEGAGGNHGEHGE